MFQSLFFLLIIIVIWYLVYTKYSRKLPVVYFKNPNNEKMESLKVGFNFLLFFFGLNFLGLFLFLGKLKNWGVFCLCFDIIALYIIGKEHNIIVTYVIELIGLGFSIYFGLKGNELSGKQLLKDGYEFVDPDSENVIYAKKKWCISQIES